MHIAMRAPHIIAACIEGVQPARLTAKAMVDAGLPDRWEDQRRMLGSADTRKLQDFRPPHVE